MNSRTRSSTEDQVDRSEIGVSSAVSRSSRMFNPFTPSE